MAAEHSFTSVTADANTEDVNADGNILGNVPDKQMDTKTIPQSMIRPNVHTHNHMALDSTLSIEDNTQQSEHGDQHGAEQHWSYLRQRRTLHMAEDALELFRQAIMTKLDDEEAASDTNNQPERFNLADSVKSVIGSRKPSSHSSTPPPPSPTHAALDDPEENVYKERIQVGSENMMVVCEPKETKTKQIMKQVGDKNIMLNIQIFSSACQMMDGVTGNVIPLDSDGEVWLEIKRRSDGNAESKTSDRGVPSGAPSRNSDGDGATGHPDPRPRTTDSRAGLHRTPTENTDYSSSDDTIGKEYRQANDDQSAATQREVDNMLSPNLRDNTLNTHSTRSIVENSFIWEDARISERNGMLSLKRESHEPGEMFIDRDDVDEPAFINKMLGHKKVQEFMLSEGSDFNVSICQWEYEREPVYSYAVTDVRTETDEPNYDTVSSTRGRPPASISNNTGNRHHDTNVDNIMARCGEIDTFDNREHTEVTKKKGNTYTQKTPKLKDIPRQRVYDVDIPDSNEQVATGNVAVDNKKPVVPPRLKRPLKLNIDHTAPTPVHNTQSPANHVHGSGTEASGCHKYGEMSGNNDSQHKYQPPIPARSKQYCKSHDSSISPDTPATPIPALRPQVHPRVTLTPASPGIRSPQHKAARNGPPPVPKQRAITGLTSPRLTSPPVQIPPPPISNQSLTSPPVPIPPPPIPGQSLTSPPVPIPPPPISNQSLTSPPVPIPPPPISNRSRDQISTESRCTWYHEDVDGDQSAERLWSVNQEDVFLVRPASNNFNQNHKYTLDLVHGGEIKKLKIIQNADGRGFMFEHPDRRNRPNREIFGSLDEMIDAVIQTGLEIDVGEESLKTIGVQPLNKTFQ